MSNDSKNQELPIPNIQASQNWWQRQPRWRRITLYVFTVYIFLLKGGPWIEYKIHRWMMPPTLSLDGMNYTDNWVSLYWVNGVLGGGVSPKQLGGQGGTACCIALTKDTKQVEIMWEFSRTEAEINAGVKPTRFTKIVPITSFPDDAFYLYTHFYPGQRVEVEVTATRPVAREVMGESHYEINGVRH